MGRPNKLRRLCRPRMIPDARLYNQAIGELRESVLKR